MGLKISKKWSFLAFLDNFYLKMFKKCIIFHIFLVKNVNFLAILSLKMFKKYHFSYIFGKKCKLFKRIFSSNFCLKMFKKYTFLKIFLMENVQFLAILSLKMPKNAHF